MANGIGSDNYVVIQGWMCNELNLKGNDLLVFALIYGFSQDDKSVFSGGRKYIAETFNISLPTVDKALQNLLEKKLIVKESSNDYIHTDIYKAGGSKETLLGVVKKLYEGSKETLPNNIYNNILDNSNNTNVLLEQPTAVPLVSSNKSNIGTSVSVNSNKPKKKNLYEKCLDKIDEQIDSKNIELKELLQEYLKVRLERKDIPLGASSFEGMLKKLKKLSDDIQEQIKIVQQSIDRQYPTFYPLYDGKKTKGGQDQRVFSEYGQVKSVRAREEDIVHEQF